MRRIVVILALLLATRVRHSFPHKLTATYGVRLDTY